MENQEKISRRLSVRKQSALITLLIAAAYIIGAAFFIQGTNHDEKLTINVPLIPEIPAPVCPSRSFTGVPCPICGITTSSMLFFDGDIAGSFGAHPLGPLVAVLFILSVPYNLWLLTLRDTEESLSDESRRTRNRKISMSITGVIFLSWILSLSRHFHLINW